MSQYTVTIAESSNLLLKGTATDANIANIFQGQSVVAYSRVDPSVCWFGMISKVKKPGEDKNKSSSDEEYSDSLATIYKTRAAVSSKERYFAYDIQCLKQLGIGVVACDWIKDMLTKEEKEAQ